MSTMTKRVSRVLGGFGVMLGISVPALAELPPSLDRVPEDAAIVVSVRNLAELHERAGALFELIQVGDSQQVLGMAQMILSTPGLDETGSIALAILPGDDGTVDFDSEAPPMVLIVPVDNFGDLAQALDGRAADNGLFDIELMGEEAFLRDLGGGWAALSPNGELLEDFEGRAGNLRSHERRFGSAGNEIADHSSIFVAVDIVSVAPYIREGVEGFQGQMGMMAMMMGEQAQGMEQFGQLIGDFTDQLIEQGEVVLMGVGMSDTGLSIDLGAQFRAGTEMARMMDADADARDLLRHVPDMPFLFAASVDTTSPAVKQMFGKLADLGAQMNPAGGEMMGFGNFLKMIDDQDGMAFVMGNPPAIMMGGLFANTLQFTKTSDPAALLDTTSTMMSELNGMEQQGISFSTSFKRDATTVEGVPVHSWGMKMQFDPADPGAQQAQMGMMMIFGPQGGPSGYYAAIDEGLITTFSQSTPLMSQAIEAARAGNGLGAQASIRNAAGQLPGNSVVQVYIGIDEIMQQVGGVMAMMGGGLDIEIPQNMGPIAIGASMQDGGFVGRIYMPEGVVKLIGEFAKMADDGGDWEDDGWEEDDDEGSPRF